MHKFLAVVVARWVVSWLARTNGVLQCAHQSSCLFHPISYQCNQLYKGLSAMADCLIAWLVP